MASTIIPEVEIQSGPLAESAVSYNPNMRQEPHTPFAQPARLDPFLNAG